MGEDESRPEAMVDVDAPAGVVRGDLLQRVVILVDAAGKR